MIITVLVHRFYNSAVVDATIEDELSLKKLGGVELNGTKLRFNSQPQDSLYAEPVIIELTTRNMPDSLFLWQNGKRTTAIKTSDNKFTVEMSKYDDMVTEFIK